MEINRTLLRPNYELRMQARERLRGNWGMAILLCLMYSIVCGLPSMVPYIGWIVGILIAGPMLLGLAICFVGFVRQDNLRFESLFDGFKNFSSALVLQLLIILFTFLWSLLFLIPGKAKWFVLAYFIFNLFVLVMSTIMVFRGREDGIENVRFLFVFKLPWDMPNYLNLSFPDWVVHLSYRMYSMMFTTTVLGLLLAWIFRPRTWCTVCPINTVSDLALKKR